jgi:Na+/H+ antiporter NhaD/arsenite permease-like protein
MGNEILHPNPWMILPFGILLGMIAVGPLWFSNWWNKHYPKVAFTLGAITLAYYLAGFSGEESQLAHHAIGETAHEYLSFITLIGALYVVSGGIHINVKGEATPFVNAVFLLIGAIIANVLGTTGASMLLIRPWLRMNKYRVTAHHVVFFILIVSNVGGCLTPIGDPPLFLGYIEGIPFWWVAEHCWPMWLVAVGMLLVMFFLVDLRNFRRAPKDIREKETASEQWRFDGLINVFFLAVILGAVFIKKPFMREAIMMGAAVASYFATRKQVHEANHFNFHPIQEVAILFIGIFLTMMPALHWLEGNASKIGRPTPTTFYWGSGTLSSVLDNAPTYLSFLSATAGSIDPEAIKKVETALASKAEISKSDSHFTEVNATLEGMKKYFPAAMDGGKIAPRKIKVAYLLGNHSWNALIVAISIGAVFFGACTYIGNGPNFMVKAIAEHQKVRTPHFMEYIFKFSLPFMLPTLAVVWWLFFRG